MFAVRTVRTLDRDPDVLDVGEIALHLFADVRDDTSVRRFTAVGRAQDRCLELDLMDFHEGFL